jgi:hypothetical protein
VIGHFWGEPGAKVVEHNGGYVTFLVALGGVALVARWLPGLDSAPKAVPASAPAAPSGSVKFGFVAAIFIISLGLAGLGYLKPRVRLGKPGVRIINVPVFSEKGEIAGARSVYLPSSLPGFVSDDRPIQTLEFGYLPPDTLYGRKIYTSADRSFAAQVSVVLMGADRTSIHKPEACLTGVGWDIRSSRKETVQLASGKSMDVARFDMATSSPGGSARDIGGVYVFWFVADGIRTWNHFTREWSLVRSIITGQEIQRWAYVSVFNPCRPGQEDAAFQKIGGLIKLLQPEVEQGDIKGL